MVCGVTFARFRQPAIVGFILAGVLLGPEGLGLVDDRGAVSTLAELGIVMLLFVIGTELSVKRFVEVWHIALLTTVLQVAGSVGIALGVDFFIGRGLGTSILLGFAMALSSTAVVIKLLDQSGERNTRAGRLTVGVLIAQDMAVVPMLLSLNALTAGGFSLEEGAKVVGSIVVLALLVIVLLRREIKLPFASFVAGNNDLAPLAAFAYCFGGAAVAGWAGLSAGYGAFLIGLIIGNSSHGHKISRHALPIQAVLLMVFFLSVGLLLDLRFLWANIGTVLAFLLTVTVLKTVLNIGALRIQRIAWGEAFLAGVAMAQIGEFSFLLAGAGVDKGLLKENQAQLVIAVTVLSLVISPLWLLTMRRLAVQGQAFESLRELLNSIYGGEARAARNGWLRVRTRMEQLPFGKRMILLSRLSKKRGRRAMVEVPDVEGPLAGMENDEREEAAEEAPIHALEAPMPRRRDAETSAVYDLAAEDDAKDAEKTKDKSQGEGQS